MRLETEFAVAAPVQAVYGLVAEVGHAVSCVSGAELIAGSADAAELRLRVRLGPVTREYRASVEIVERDPVSHRVVLRVHAEGTDATVELRLRGIGDATMAAFTAKPAPTSAATAPEVVDKLAGRFARNLVRALPDTATAPVPVQHSEPPVGARPSRTGVAAIVVAGLVAVAAARRAKRA